MKLCLYISYIMLILVLLNSCCCSKLGSKVKRNSMDRSEMIKAENKEYFKNFLFKETGDNFIIDSFTGGKRPVENDPVAPKIKSKKSILLLKQKVLENNRNKNKNHNDYKHSNESNFSGLNSEEFKNGINYKDYNYGPLVRPGKIGVIYGESLGGSFSTHNDNNNSEIEAISDRASSAHYESNSSNENSDSSSSSNSSSNSSSAARSAFESHSSQVASSQQKYQAMSEAERIQSSGINGGINLDAVAAGNTVSTDENGNSIQSAHSRSSSSASAFGSASTSASSQSSSLGQSNYKMAENSQSSQGFYSKEFSCRKDNIIKSIDPRYKIIKLMDHIVNDDNSIRFFCVDTTSDRTVVIKVFFKGIPHNCEFYNQFTDKGFIDSSRDCKNNQIINNRLYRLPKEYNQDYSKFEGKEIYPDVQFPLCNSSNSLQSGDNFFHQVYDLPSGENLNEKCIKEGQLDNTNTCIPFLRSITKGVLHGIDILNSGNSFYLHGNITPNNLYLKMWLGEQKVFLDNIKFDNQTYDDINKKPYKFDMNMLGDTLLQLLIGTTDPSAISYPIKNAYDLYVKVKNYLRQRGIPLNIKSSALNVPAEIDSNNVKIVTAEEYMFKLSKSIFDMIYRLKNINVMPNNQFRSVSQALKHEFLYESGPSKNGNLGRENEVRGSSPSDY